MRSAPLTARQTLMWLDHRLYPAAPYHNLVLTVELEGALDVDRMERAFAALVAENDSLRVAVREDDVGARLEVADEHAIRLEHVDLSAASESRADWLRQRCTRMLDLSQTSGDAALVRLSPTRHLLYFCQHHIACDGSSLVEICDQLGARYSGRPVVAGPSLLEYAGVEAEYRHSQRATRATAFWAETVARGVPPFALYGTARTSTAVGTRRAAIDLDAATLAAFSARAQQAPFLLATPELSHLTLLLTAFFAWIQRVTGHSRIAIGVPVRNRPARFRKTLGLLMEQPFVIVDVDPGDTIASLADKTRKALFDALRHAQHTLSDRGVFYATMNLHPWVEPDFDGLHAQVEIGPAPARAENVTGAAGDLRETLGLLVFDQLTAGRLDLALELHADTFPEALQERARHHLCAVIRAIATGNYAPGSLRTPIDAIELMDEPERTALLEAGRGRMAPIAPDLIERIRERAQQAPAATALVGESGSLTYAELAVRTNQLARHLHSLGVGPEVRVGLYLTRGLDEPLAMLGVLAAGGAYVPIDPTHPPERVALALQDSSPTVLLTTGRLAGRLDVPAGVRVVDLDQEWARIRRLDGSSPAVEFRPDQLAYVMFTSGSTGRPKGIAVARQALSNLLQSMAHEPGFAAADRLLALTTMTFDIAGLEMFLPLWAGGSLQIGSRETALDPLVLRRTLERNPITVLQATPTTWRLLVESGWAGTSGLRMFCGGEALAPELARALVTRGAELWNLYGPTEATIWSTAKRLEPGFERVTIGRAIDRTQTYVLDGAHRLVPQGVVGELYIGGDGLARGYLAARGADAERFATIPLGAGAERVYRTGDLARVLPDGDIECLGRSDHQVKVRGVRIELGEIESVLRSAPGVQDAVVVARATAGEASRLVAYWVGTPEVDPAVVQERARQRLPEAMQPGAWMRLDAFPLNTNGKIDRAALPEPADPGLASTGVRSRALHELSNHEARVAAIWRDLLGRRDIGTDDDFFESGGDSLLAVGLRARLRKEFGVELPLTAIFEGPTVARMTKALERQDGLLDRPVAIELRRSESGPPLFCLLGLALYQPLANALRADCSVYGVHVPFSLDRESLTPQLVPLLAARYVDTIRETRPHGPYHIGGLCFGGVLAHEVTRQLLEAGEVVESLSLFDAMLPRAQHRLHAKQLLHLCRRVVQEPQNVQVWLEGWSTRFASRARLRAGSLGFLHDLFLGRQSATPAELRVLSPEAEMAAKSYDRLARPVQTSTLLFRATNRDFPPWLDIAPDYGWSSLTHKFSTHDVSGGHVEIMQEPHVQAIARVLDDVFRRPRAAGQPPQPEADLARLGMRGPESAETEEDSNPLAQRAVRRGANRV